MTDTEYFAKNVWGPVLSQKCIACHNPLGLANGSKLVLHSSSEAGFLDENLEIVREVASFQKDGQSLLLLKPTRTVEHGGGHVIEVGSDAYEALEKLVKRFEEPIDCPERASAFFDGVVLATPDETLRRAAIALVGRLPTADEEASVAGGDMVALDAALSGMMTEEAFFDRLKEIYNDSLLTDRYLPNDDAIAFLEDVTGTNGAWYTGVHDAAAIAYFGAKSPADLALMLSTRTNEAVAREPLELIAHVVRNDRPFSEIVTADYLLLNPYSARAYGVTLPFQDDRDPAEMLEGKLGGGFPHAGLLTSTMFLNRHPTTSTNRNRHRARVVSKWFLGTDILKTAEQPIDVTAASKEPNPTLNDPACTVCHANMDPIAGAFHNFDSVGAYAPGNVWYSDMRPPGFGAETVPDAELPTSIQWLGRRIADDPRFALSAVYIVYKGLTGVEPLPVPTDLESPDYEARFDAYLAQYEEFSKIAVEYAASGKSFKAIVKGIILSPYFRAKNAAPSEDARADALAELGVGLLLPPEVLNRKIQAVLGYPWRVHLGDQDFLTDGGVFRLLYGGIDSSTVTRRIHDPNGVMVNIADRMANEMSCWAVPRDLAASPDARLLFPYVDMDTMPAPGAPADDPAMVAIRENMQYLHARILGEKLALDDPEIQRTMDLFLATLEEGKAGLAAGYDSKLPPVCRVLTDFWAGEELPMDQWLEEDPDYVIRSWMAVVSYMLSDYSFLYE